MRYPTTYQSIALGSTLILGIIAIVIAIPQRDLIISNYGYDKIDNHVSFIIANNGDEIAYVDRIELEITNVQLLNECSKDNIKLRAVYPKLMVPLNITMNDDVYNMVGFLENIRSFYPEGNMDYYPIENGLKYSIGDLDGFNQHISLIDNNGTRMNSGYAFDAKIKVFWCEINQCDEKSILESSKFTGVNPHICRDGLDD